MKRNAYLNFNILFTIHEIIKFLNILHKISNSITKKITINLANQNKVESKPRLISLYRIYLNERYLFLNGNTTQLFKFQKTKVKIE